MTHNGCKSGNCSVLLDDSVKCDFRRVGNLEVCEFMNQSTGACMSKRAKKHAAPERKKNYMDSYILMTLEEKRAHDRELGRIAK